MNAIDFSLESLLVIMIQRTWFALFLAGIASSSWVGVGTHSKDKLDFGDELGLKLDSGDDKGLKLNKSYHYFIDFFFVPLI